MKKFLNYFIASILIFLTSCGGSGSNETTPKNKENPILANEEATEKVWKDFTVRGVGNTMAEMKFDIGNITVGEGSWVRITLVNEGVDNAMQHNIVFINYGTRKEIASLAIAAGSSMKYVPNNENVIAASDLAMPGETVVLEFEAPSKGNYEYLCTYPGHGEIMRGYFFVK
jgi:azurin